MARNLTQDQREAIDKLRELLPEGSTVWTITRHVSRSGMTRAISPVIVTARPQYNGKPTVYEPTDVSWLVNRAGIFAFDRRRGGVKVGGTGMDMGFHLVYTIAQTIHDDGYALNHRQF